MKLKTLRELKFSREYSHDKDIKSCLKKMGIDWIKRIEENKAEMYCPVHDYFRDIGDFDKSPCNKDCVELDNFAYENSDFSGAIKILKHIFNITDEDLK